MNIPVIHPVGTTIPEAWEHSIEALQRTGIEIDSQYTKENELPTIDATAMIEIKDPMKEPHIPMEIPGGRKHLEDYVNTVTEGTMDGAVYEGKIPYTYHERLRNYKGRDQIKIIADNLRESPISRRAQAITWIPEKDNFISEPPCLQRLWFRLVPGEEYWYLNMNVHMRSNDALKAAPMNMYAFSKIQGNLFRGLSLEINKIKMGRYVHIADSYHVYGSDRKDLNRFNKAMKERSFEERTINNIKEMV